MSIQADDDLETVAFEVCTALQQEGLVAVLTGGSAATVYAPDAYQSADLDFVLHFGNSPDKGACAEARIIALGYEHAGNSYRHASNPLLLEFPPGPLMIGSEHIDRWATRRRGEELLHILSPTDCCKDRLAAFLHWSDRSGLQQALAVAKAQRKSVDVEEIERWAIVEGGTEKFQEFAERLR